VAKGKGKRRRSLHEAFGQEAPRPAAEAESAAGPPEADGRAEQAPTLESRTSRRPASGGAPRQGGRSRVGKARKTPDTAKDAGKGKVAAITGQGEAKMVPGKNGEMVPAEKPVNMTFTVTAKERYLWMLELKRRGLTAVSVLRETMEDMMGEADR
jgi:ParB-like chromosome segregation protein Spo0J